MAPLATAFVAIIPNMAGFVPATAAGIRSANLAALGAGQGAAFGGAFSRSAAKLIAAGSVIGFGLLVKEAVQAAGNFEAAMVRLTTSAGETGTLVSGNLKIVADGIKGMAGSVGFSVTDLGKAMYLVESAGFRAADGLNVLRFAAEAAKAENSDLTTVVDALTTTMIDYHKPASDAANVMNTLLAAAATSKVNLNDLAASLHSVLPAASRAGIGLNDILGALSSMTLHGYSAQQATQNLADVIRHMQNPTAIQAKELALLGLTTNQLAADLRSKGLTGTLQEIADRIAKLMPPGSQKVILDLRTALGTLSPEVQKLGNELIKGSISFADYRKAARELDPVQNAQAMSFYQLAAATHRIGDEQMTGAKVLQVFGQALARATGDATGMNVALMLTGENAEVTNDIVRRIGAAALEAGGHVKGWAAIQETFNFKLAATKASLGVLMIAIGSTLLPMFGRVMQAITAVLGPMASWITEHQRLTSIVMASVTAFVSLGVAVLVIGKLGAGIVALANVLRLAAIATWLWNAAVSTFSIITSAANIQIALYLFWSKAVAIATRAWAAVQWALNAAFIASPVGLIVVAIAALVAGVIYAYFHFETFRRFVDKLWQSLQVAAQVIWSALVVAFHAVGDAAVWLWEHAIGPAFRAIVTAGKAVGDAGIWLWEHALGPAFRFIAAGVKIWWEYAQIAFGLWVAAARVVGDIAVWLWEHAVGPAFRFMVVVIKAWWDYAQIVFGVFHGAVNVIGAVVLWLWHNAFEPAFHAIGTVLQAWWVIVQVIFALVRLYIVNILGPQVLWLWQHIFVPAFNAMREIVTAWWGYVRIIFGYVVGFITDVLGPIFVALWHKYVEPAWAGIRLVISAAWAGMKPVFDLLVNMVTKTIPDAFRSSTGFIGKAWSQLVGICATPMNFVIRYVVNDGIIKAWNTVAGWVGLPKDQRIPKVDPIPFADGGQVTGGVKAFANGGVLRGIGGPRQDNIPIMASVGEYIIPANVVSDIGAGWFDSLIGKRKPDHPGDGSSGIAIGRYAAGGLIGAIADPAGWVGDQVNGLVSRIPGAGIVHDIGIAASRKLVAGLIEWVKNKVAAFAGLGTTGFLGPITTGIAGVQNWLRAQNGKPYVWASAGPRGFDCSGIVSAAWNLMHGAPPNRHTFSTMGQSLFFPKRNQWGPLTAGWANPGERGGGSVGHTAANLAGLGIESTGSRGVRIGAGTTPVTNFAHWGTFADGGLVRSFDRGGSWPSGTYGVNTSGRTETVTSGDGMDRVEKLLVRIERAVDKVAPALGRELNGAASSLHQMARTY